MKTPKTLRPIAFALLAAFGPMLAATALGPGSERFYPFRAAAKPPVTDSG